MNITWESLGLNPDDPKDSLTTALKLIDEPRLKQLRQHLFDEARQKGLVHTNSQLVTRLRRARGSSMQVKLTDDIVTLIYHLRNRLQIPRVLLKNGKRDINTFVESRDREAESVPVHPTPTVSSEQPTTEQSVPRAIDIHEATHSNRVDEQNIANLEKKVNNLVKVVESLRSNISDKKHVNAHPCYIYVRVVSERLRKQLGTTALEEILHCRVINYTLISDFPSLKVKISQKHLYKALSADKKLVRVRLWYKECTMGNDCNPPPLMKHHAPITPNEGDLKVTTWNCRGFKNGEPYVNELAQNADIVIITEHWLWPFEAHKLNQVHGNFSAEYCCDARLSDSSILRKGCGGIAVLYRKNLQVTAVLNILSDRICGIRIKSDSSVYTILGVYMPCMDQGLDCYREHLVELERCISEGQQLGAVIIAGDLNAHIGTLGGPRGSGQPNRQGILLKDLIDRCSLHVLSLSSRSQGQTYTYWNDSAETTVDYIIGDYVASCAMTQCYTHSHAHLNTSDHLPITTVLRLKCQHYPNSTDNAAPTINWAVAKESPSLSLYQERVTESVSKFVANRYDNVSNLNSDLQTVAQLLRSASLETLPLFKPNRKKRRWYNDSTLAQLAKEKKVAWDNWKDGNRPQSGHLYENKCKTQKSFKQRLNFCVASEQRKQIQSLDKRFAERHPSRFKLPKKNNSQGSTLRVDGEVCSDPDRILQTWFDHFKTLSSSHESDFPALGAAKDQYNCLYDKSLENDEKEDIIDTPFTLAEVSLAIKNLKSKKAAGLDHLQAEHLKLGGDCLALWLTNVFNSIIELEVVPDALKEGVIKPIYKGNGRDPLDTNSYRGITLTSVLSKTLEILLLGRIRVTLCERSFPHINQSGFVKKTSCIDAIFSSYEALSRLTRRNENAYLCFFDLQKAFDTVQYPILLKQIFDCGINGKAWRLLDSWYKNPRCMVQIRKNLSQSFCLERGVLQGSVLSPTLFLMVINPLLQLLDKHNIGPRINNLFCGAFAHADDIRTIATSRDTLDKQIELIESFTRNNALLLNAQKCEVVCVTTKKATGEEHLCTVAGNPLRPTDSAKCLGHWWSWDLSSDKAIEEAIGKARRCFFAFGAVGAFDGQLNPLSGRAIFETCVTPILLYDSENWYITEPLLKKLESAQAEIGRRILRVSKFHSTRAVRLALDWPSMATRILIRKLVFLRKMQTKETNLSGQFLSSLSQPESDTLKLIDSCVFLENTLDLSGTLEKISTQQTCPRNIKLELTKADRCSLIEVSTHHESTRMAAEIAKCTNWLRIWDEALDLGKKGTTVIQSLFREMTRPVFGSTPCYHCPDTTSLSHSYFEHYLAVHVHHNSISTNDILERLTATPPEISELLELLPHRDLILDSGHI